MTQIQTYEAAAYVIKCKMPDDEGLNEIRFDSAKLHLLLSLLISVALMLVWILA